MFIWRTTRLTEMEGRDRQDQLPIRAQKNIFFKFKNGWKQAAKLRDWKVKRDISREHCPLSPSHVTSIGCWQFNRKCSNARLTYLVIFFVGASPKPPPDRAPPGEMQCCPSVWSNTNALKNIGMLWKQLVVNIKLNWDHWS